jgi:hypothetical protein
MDTAAEDMVVCPGLAGRGKQDGSTGRVIGLRILPMVIATATLAALLVAGCAPGASELPAGGQGTPGPPGAKTSSTPDPETPMSAAASVVVNGVRLTPEDLAGVEQHYGVRVPAGAYWYDPVCGAWGLQGGPTLGFTIPGLDIGGPLRADASGGDTGVFINGRELRPEEVAYLQQLVQVSPGRYWLDASGCAGYEGGPALVNLVQLARSRGGGPRGRAWHYAGPGGYAGSDGHTSYFFDPETGSSVMTGE